MMHVKTLGMAAVMAAGLGFGATAHAAPLAPAQLGTEGGALVEQIRDGCGWGAARNYYGECKFGRNYDPRAYGGASYARPYAPGYGAYGPPRPRPYYRPYY